MLAIYSFLVTINTENPTMNYNQILITISYGVELKYSHYLANKKLKLLLVNIYFLNLNIISNVKFLAITVSKQS